jgi:hypothetical protein
LFVLFNALYCIEQLQHFALVFHYLLVYTFEICVYPVLLPVFNHPDKAFDDSALPIEFYLILHQQISQQLYLPMLLQIYLAWSCRTPLNLTAYSLQAISICSRMMPTTLIFSEASPTSSHAGVLDWMIL